MEKKTSLRALVFISTVFNDGIDEHGRLSARVISKVTWRPGTRPRSIAAIRRVYSILLADDSTLFRDGVAAICKTSLKYSIVSECGDGLTAASAIEAQKPDIAILKINLPELHGTEVIRRARQSGSETRFLALAAQSDTRTAMDALRSGANGCLLTSDSAGCLLEALQQILEGNLYVSPSLALKGASSQARYWPDDPLASLSVREHQVFSLLVSGLRPKQIANRLNLSLKTVDTYRSNLMKKLEIFDLPGLVKLAIQQNVTSLT